MLYFTVEQLSKEKFLKLLREPQQISAKETEKILSGEHGVLQHRKETETKDEPVVEAVQEGESDSGTESAGEAVVTETEAEISETSEAVSGEPETAAEADQTTETAAEEPVENSGDSAEDKAEETPAEESDGNERKSE